MLTFSSLKIFPWSCFFNVGRLENYFLLKLEKWILAFRQIRLVISLIQSMNGYRLMVCGGFNVRRSILLSCPSIDPFCMGEGEQFFSL